MSADRRFLLPVLILAAVFMANGGAALADSAVCFSASKAYQIHPLQGGADLRDGWAVQGGAFAECVHRAIAAEKVFLKRYPDTRFGITTAATIGCHSPCQD